MLKICIYLRKVRYKYVLQMDEAYEDDLEMAAQELKELAASYNIELDAWTKEAIGDILGVE